jgi:sulfur transfer protein SufE
MTDVSTKLADIRSDFSLLDDWEDRYRYIIELGRALPPMPAELKTESTKVRGCMHARVKALTELVRS